MRRLNGILLVVAGIAVMLAAIAGLLDPPARAEAKASDGPPELAYLKQVNDWRSPSDPQLIFLLMAQFANAGRHAEGIEYFGRTLQRFGPALDDTRKALYLTALASLRAGYAPEVFVLKRAGWVRDTVTLLDEAKRLTRGEAFLPRWMSGVVRARLPGFFGEREHAREDLRWCETHWDRAPHAGWLREVYASRAELARENGDAIEATRYAELGGSRAERKPAIFTTPFSEDRANGHAFAPRSVREIVAGTVYLVSGFEFTEYSFVVSDDRRELIAIDAGTRADAAQAALAALRAEVPSLPPVTTVLVTHAHWDHVGGHRYFRSLEPPPRFIGRANYREELAKDAMADPAVLKRFFGTDFSLDDVLAYKPDVAINRPTELVIGGTHFQLLPTRGGETNDAMLIHLPGPGVLFVGDILMPYVGAPFVEEGSVDGMVEAIDQVHALKPRHVLHGHEPLTRLFASSEMLDDLRGHLVWLRAEILRAIQSGAERGAIQAANLMPPNLERSESSVHLAYLVLRENVINRVFDQHTGYWQNGLSGLDALTQADYGALIDALGVSDENLASAAERLVVQGRHEQAAALLRWTQSRVAGNTRLQAVQRLAYLRLMEKYQEFNPFKFILYAAQIDQSAPQVAAPGVVHAKRD